MVFEIPVVTAAGDGGSVLLGHSARRGEIRFTLSSTVGADPTDTAELSEAEVTERERVWQAWMMLLETVPSLAKSYIASTAPQVSAWYGRSIKGRASVTLGEYMSGSSRVDGVVPVSWPLGQGGLGTNPPLRFPKTGYAIPYGALLPTGIEGLLVAGQALSAETSVLPGVSTPAACMGMGDVAGRAAAAAVRLGRLPSALDPVELANISARQNGEVTVR